MDLIIVGAIPAGNDVPPPSWRSGLGRVGTKGLTRRTPNLGQ
jgi:hypothetical protein